MGAQSELYYMMSCLLRFKYGTDITWSVEISTKRVKGAKYGDPGSQNKYTLYVHKDGHLHAISDEIEGHNKSYWSGDEYALFYHTLTEV